MNLRKLLLGVALSAITGILVSLGVAWVMNTSSTVSAGDNAVGAGGNPVTTINEVVKSAPFQVKLPDWLPFESNSSWAHSTSAEGRPRIELNYPTGFGISA